MPLLVCAYRAVMVRLLLRKLVGKGRSPGAEFLPADGSGVARVRGLGCRLPRLA